MGLFGDSASDRLVDEVYPFLWQATERFKEAKFLREHIDTVAARTPWIDKHDLEDMWRCLESYAFAMLAFASVKLSKSSRLKDRPFFNVAIQSKDEQGILAVFFGEEASRAIKHRILDFDGEEPPSVREVL